MYKYLSFLVVCVLLLFNTGCSTIQKGAGASSISYPLNASPLATDQALGIDDPAGTWAINRFSYDSVWGLYESLDYDPTGALDFSNASSVTSGPIILTPIGTLPTPATDGKIFAYTGLSGFLGNGVFSFYDGTTPVYTVGFETPPTTTGEVPTFNSVTGKFDFTTPSGGSFSFDTYPVYEDSAHISGIAVNATTLAIYSDDASKWLTVGLTDSLGPTPIIPTFTSSTVDGVDLQVIFSTPVSQGAGWLESLFTVDATVTGAGIGMTFVDTDGTNTWNFTLDTAVVEADVVTLDYPVTANGVESSTGDDLGILTAEAVTNNTTSSITIAYVAVATGTIAGATGVTADMPIGTTDGMIMVAIIENGNGAATYTPDTDWLLIDSIANGTDVVQYAYYKIASSESGPYTFTSSTATSASLHIATFSKTSGSWTVPTGTNLSNTSTSVSATNVTGSVTIPALSMLVCSWGNDGSYTPSTPPSGMTEVSTVSAASISLATYYESGLSGATTKTMIWPSGDQTTSIAVVLGAE